MKNSILFILLIILVGLTTLEFQKKFIKKHSTSSGQTTAIPHPTLNPIPKIKETPIDKSLEGEYGCLPYKDQSKKPSNLDCALGLKLEEGSYVALKLGDFNDTHNILKPGNKLRVSGEFVPVGQLTASIWQKYSISGIIRAREIKKI